MERSSSSLTSADQMIHLDIESNASIGAEKKRGPRIKFYKIPVPFRNGHLGPDMLKFTAFIMTALCVFQFLWIRHIQKGLVRIPNDYFDNMFWNVNRDDPSIWESDRISFIHNTIPVPVHSHNDYWRRIPLFEALGSGCISVEADVHLKNSDLLVGHTSMSVRDDETLRSMYLEPLQRMLEMRNAEITDDSWRGIFDLAPKQTVVLLIDVKTSGIETIAELNAQLQPLRDLDYLTYWNGTARVMRPLTIVASGNAPFESITALNATHRDIFWDAKLDGLISADDNFDVEPPVYAYNPSNSYFASTIFWNARLFALHNDSAPRPSTPALKDAAMSQIDQAKARGLIARYWDTPSSPPNLRDVAWRVLITLRVGILNMDDLGTVRARASGWGSIEL